MLLVRIADDSKDSKKSAAFVHIQRQVLSIVTSVFRQSGVFFRNRLFFFICIMESGDAGKSFLKLMKMLMQNVLPISGGSD